MSLFSRTDGPMFTTSERTAELRRPPSEETRATPDNGDAATHLQVLGLKPGVSWDEVTAAHGRLVSDLTPGPDASHRNVALAQELLHEVNQAYASLRVLSVA